VSVTELLASLVGSLAWPLAVVAIVLVFRHRLRSLLEIPIQRLTVGPGGVELQWQHGAAVVAQSVVATALTRTEGNEQESERLMALAATAPEAAVVEGFALVERELRNIAVSAGLEGAERKSGSALAEAAAGAGAITAASAEGIRGLATLRDLSALGWGEPTTAAHAVQYVMLVRALLYALRAPPAPTSGG